LEYHALSGTTVLNVTASVVPVEYEWYGDLVFVTSIAGVPNDSERGLWWQYWVNGELGPVAANKYVLNNKDLVEWRRSPADTDGEDMTDTTIMDPSLYPGIVVTIAWGLLILVVLLIRRRVK